MIRYSGDEFVIVAPGAAPDEVLGRLDPLQARLRFDRAGAPAITFSAGHAYLPVHGRPEDALRAADEAMYRDKTANQKRRSRA